MRYPSKIGPELVVVLAISLAPGFYMALQDNAWQELLIPLAIGTFIIYMVAATHYTIDGSVLIIKSGFIYNKRIDIQSIRKIAATGNLVSSPAASIDRIEVFYNRYDSVIISPKDKKGFIAHLQRLNPLITSAI